MKQTNSLAAVIFALTLVFGTTKAQVTIGTLDDPHVASILTLRSSSQWNKDTLGLKLPVVALPDTAKLNLGDALVKDNDVDQEAVGMLIYNKTYDPCNGLVPCMYVWDGATWHPAGCALEGCPPKPPGFYNLLWYFGNNSSANSGSPGLKFTNTGGSWTVSDASGVAKINTEENSLTISSDDGTLLFYSQHDMLYNIDNEPMENGSFKGNASTADGLAAAYMGANKYLMFAVSNGYAGNLTTTATTSARAIDAYIIDLEEDNGRGAKIRSIQIEPERTSIGEGIELIPRAGTSYQYFLIYTDCKTSCPTQTQRSTKMYSRLIVIDSINHNNIISQNLVDSIFYFGANGDYGLSYQLKANHQHNKIAMANTRWNVTCLVDFNNSTGRFVAGSQRGVNINGASRYANYSVEFSPDDQYLYTSNYVDNNGTANPGSEVRIRQWKISDLTNVLNGQTNVYTTPLWEIQYWTQTTYPRKGGGMQLGPDGNIYVLQSYSNKVGVISNPNSGTDLSTRYNANAITLSVTVADAIGFCEGLTPPAVPIVE
ncbi:MAG: hypothetical protein LBR66_05905 [Candidatus Symbiothrix sp.]|jgi:hypothetical protein|nr:hypothetical protein [Candidatus Symbiothrix sp.]